MAEGEPFSRLCVFTRIFSSENFRRDGGQTVARWREKKYIRPTTIKAKFLLWNPITRLLINAGREFEKIFD